jgi:galactokinase/mevalonate kinase-like predicted kinase
MFIAFSGYKFLHNLRNQGFLTFCDVVDESYDLIKDDRARYTAAFEQVKRLCSMDQEYVYNTLKLVLEHNYNHIMNTDWTARAAQDIQKRLDIVLAQAA